LSLSLSFFTQVHRFQPYFSPRNCNHNIRWKQFKFRRKAKGRKTHWVQLDNSFSRVSTLTVGSLINESACAEIIINVYDFSQYLYAFGVYLRRKSVRTKFRILERKVAQIVDIFSTVGWKLLFLFVVQQFVPAYASCAHINACSSDIFSIRDIAQRANTSRIRKCFPSLFVAHWVYVHVALLYSLHPFYFSPWLYFLITKCFPSSCVITSVIRAVDLTIL